MLHNPVETEGSDMRERASKYLPLQQYLGQQHAGELPLTFKDVERVLGFALPPSARAHAAWWSNNRGTNVAVKAWRDAGWRTSRVDINAERVTFVRDAERRSAPRQSDHGLSGVSEDGAAFRVDDAIVIDPVALRGGALRMLEDYRDAEGGTLSDAIVGLLNAMALQRRRQLVEWFSANAPKVSGDSTQLIREDRDAR
jgi:hypothetical protein